jgi:hypothetical protein
MGECYGFSEHGLVYLLTPLFLISCLFFFMRQQLGELTRFIRGDSPLANFDRVSFLFCVFWGTLGPLLASPRFSSLPSQRYAFALFLPGLSCHGIYRLSDLEFCSGLEAPGDCGVGRSFSLCLCL